MSVAWFDDRALVASLPWHFRLYARYSRMMVNRRSGIVRGGSFLFRMLRRAARVAPLAETARIEVAGRTAFVDLTDQRVLWVFDELRGRGPEFTVMTMRLRSGDTFVDVGANHGSFAILAAALVGPTGRVVAIEPQPRLAPLVERSLEATGVPFEVHQCAAGAEDGQVELQIPVTGSGSASVLPGYVAGQRRRVRVRVAPADTILDWRSCPGRMLLKLDVEGSEIAFLDGARAMLQTRRPAILLELNATSLHAGGYGVGELFAALGRLGYRHASELDEYPETRALDSLAPAPQRNVLVVPDE